MKNSLYFIIKSAGLTFTTLLHTIAFGLDPSIIFCLYLVGVIKVEMRARLTIASESILVAGSFWTAFLCYKCGNVWVSVTKVLAVQIRPLHIFVTDIYNRKKVYAF